MHLSTAKTFLLALLVVFVVADLVLFLSFSKNKQNQAAVSPSPTPQIGFVIPATAKSPSTY